jgi:hypothetical protein
LKYDEAPVLMDDLLRGQCNKIFLAQGIAKFEECPYENVECLDA